MDTMGHVLEWASQFSRLGLTIRAHRFDFRWLAWTCDGIDFFSVSLSVTSLGRQFNESPKSIVTGFFFFRHRALLTTSLWIDYRHHTHFTFPFCWCCECRPSLSTHVIHYFLSGHLWHPFRSFRQKMASSLQSHPHRHPWTWSRIRSNLFSIPCPPLSLWCWNGWYMGSRSSHCPRKSSCGSSWYRERSPPRRICNRLSFCSHHQSFLGSRSTSWVESIVLDCLWYFNVCGGSQGATSWEWALFASERGWESQWNGHDP